MLRPILRHLEFSQIGGIRLASFRDDESEFGSAMRGSLDLIRRISTTRYDRTVANLEWIVSSSLPAKFGGLYANPTNTCLLDFNLHWYKKNPDYMEAFYAKIIVHEATHGLLYRRGIKRRKRNRMRIERICRNEENRFALKLNKIEPGLGNQLYEEFDPAIWES